jgi:hypothetical protein
VIEKYEINYLDRNSSLETVLFNQTFEKFRERYINIEKCLAFNESKNMYLLSNYSPRYRISVIELYFMDYSYNQAYHPSGFQPDSPVLKCTVRGAEETSNRTIECPVLAQLIDQNCTFNHKIYKSMSKSCTHCNTISVFD